MKIVHVGYEHRYDDTRIFLKECKSLQRAGHEVVFVTSNKNGNTGESVIDGIKIKIVDLRGRRIIRQFRYNKELIEILLREDADLYFIHEVVLVGVGKKLLKHGKKVVYDMHEDSPRQMGTKVSKGKLKLFRPMVERIIENWENKLLVKADGCIIVAPFQIERLKKLRISHWEMICNYPILDILDQSIKKKNQICYCGGISKERGITNIVRIMEKLDCELVIAGDINSSYQEELMQYPGYEKVEFLGYLLKDDVEKLYQESLVGICTLLPTPNHIGSLPIKLFEYMNAGLPVVSSNFPNMVKIIEGENCGIVVDPNNLQEIVAAVKMLLGDGDLAIEMGQRGRIAVQKKYNWGVEEKKLFTLIERIFAPHEV